MYKTPIQKLKKISALYNADIRIKRDDLIQEFGGGNKVIKNKYIFDNALQNNANATVTAGGIQSNHCRVVALLSARYGMRCKIIIHGDEQREDVLRGNHLIMKLAGADLIYCKKKEVKSTMDDTMQNLKNKGYKPYYIYGGGHNLHGAISYFEHFKYSVEESRWLPDHIVLPSGTGTTQAGIVYGVQRLEMSIKVHGISVARKKNKGIIGVKEGTDWLNNHFRTKLFTEINFYDDYLAGGYEQYNVHLIDSIKKMLVKEGILLDPVYSGKAFWGLQGLINNQIISEKSKVLFWHTGGLYNLLSNNI